MTRPWPRRLVAFAIAVLVAAVWGAVAQTQFNLASLQALGAEVPAALRLRTTLQDLAGFGPLYASVCAVAFALAFPLAAALSARVGARAAWLAIAGLLALVVAIRLVDALVPPPVLIAATRGWVGLLAMTLGGAVGGWVYARVARLRP